MWWHDQISRPLSYKPLKCLRLLKHNHRCWYTRVMSHHWAYTGLYDKSIRIHDHGPLHTKVTSPQEIITGFQLVKATWRTKVTSPQWVNTGFQHDKASWHTRFTSPRWVATPVSNVTKGFDTKSQALTSPQLANTGFQHDKVFWLKVTSPQWAEPQALNELTPVSKMTKCFDSKSQTLNELTSPKWANTSF